MLPKRQPKVCLQALIISLAVWFGLVGSCARQPQVEPSQTPAPQETSTPSPVPTAEIRNTPCALPVEWKIDFKRSGGFAGRTQSLKISSGGDIQFTDLDTDHSSNGTLTAEELVQLGGALAQACPFQVAKPAPNCADCFSYTLSVQLDGTKFEAQTNDASAPPTLQPLIQLLNSYLQRMATPS